MKGLTEFKFIEMQRDINTKQRNILVVEFSRTLGAVHVFMLEFTTSCYTVNISARYNFHNNVIHARKIAQ